MLRSRLRQPSVRAALAALAVALCGCPGGGDEPAPPAVDLTQETIRDNEEQAISALHRLADAEARFREQDAEVDGSFDYGALGELAEAKLISGPLATGRQEGYVFDLRVSPTTPEFVWSVTASPERPGETGVRHFGLNQRGEIVTSKTPIEVDENGLFVGEVTSLRQEPGEPPAPFDPASFLADLQRDPGAVRATRDELAAHAAELLPKLVKTLEDPRPQVRSAAVRAIGLLGKGGEGGVAPLVALFDDREVLVQVALADALAELQEALPQVAARVRPSLDAADPWRVGAALRCLAELGDRASLPRVAELWHDPERPRELRAAAASCLGRLGDDAATAHLLEHLDDPDLRGPAAQALGELGLAGHAEAAIEPLSRAVEDASSSDAFARAEATKALGSVARGHPGAGVDALCKALRLDPSSTVRAAAARALGTVSADPERIRPPLLAALDDAEAVVRLDVIESLRGLPALHAAATPRLIALLDDPQDAVVEAAAEALEELAPPSALAPLRALSEDSARSQQVRQAARRAALRLERSAPNAR